MTTSDQRKKDKNPSQIAVGAGELEATEVLDTPVPNEEETLVEESPGQRRPALERKEDTPKTLMDRLESLLRMASLVAITASVVLAVFQFYQNGIAEKKKASVELMTRWQESNERNALAAISGDLEQYLEARGVIEGRVTPAALRTLKAQFGKALIEQWERGPEDENRSANIDALFNFYAEVEFCIRAELCHAPLLEAYFGTEATSFWEYFRSYADARRASFYPHYGQELEAFVNSLEREDV